MKKTKAKTRYHTITEHYLVPTALFLLNICVVHVLYVYSTGKWGSVWYLVALTGALAALGSALVVKGRYYLWCSIVYYLLLLAFPMLV